MIAAPPSAVEAVLMDNRRKTLKNILLFVLGMAVIVSAFSFAGLFDLARYRNAYSTIITLLGDSLPPDFSRWQKWGTPLLETLSMSVSGTVLGGLVALPLSALAARNIGPAWLGVPVRMLLNTLRSIPGLVWGVIFVAALGFGSLPGAFALACHSAGMLGKFYAEILEHVDPGPGNALRSHGVSGLGILRFSVWPQILPRLIDVTVYRWEHNVRAATTLGVIGAGGLGLEIITAFNLFEYREALALILVLLGLVTVINLIGARIRSNFLDPVTSR
jgi:phosphonate transport system permease protein